MAKAKSGGTRALLRGKVASDVYSIGKDDKGNRQQIVRALPESVNNPKSRDQVIQRVKMKAVSKMAGLMSAIINHSWEGVEYGTPSVSEFMRRSFEAINGDNGGLQGFPKYFLFPTEEDQNPAMGFYPVSAGSLPAPDMSVYYEDLSFPLKVYASRGLVGENPKVTVADVRSALGVSDGDYITLLRVYPEGEGRGLSFGYGRIYFEPSIPDETVVLGEGAVADAVSKLFRLEATSADFAPILAFGDQNRNFQVGIKDVFYSNQVGDTPVANVYSVIASRKLPNGQWGRSTAFLAAAKVGEEQHIFTRNAWSDAYDESAWGNYLPDVLDDWTIGRQRFLNGGAV